ncbi:protein of unknown function [Rhodovastum atsumiense]|nr:protein of unknown function [Rhodovastum atsumiense]
MCVILTDAAGFIGHHVMTGAARVGGSVVSIDRVNACYVFA